MSYLYLSKNITDLAFADGNIMDIRACYFQAGIHEVLQSIDKEFVGLVEVKKDFREISSFLLFNKIRELKGFPILNSSLHMAFTGKAGMGKSSVASKLALVLRNLGYLTKGHTLFLTREDFIGQYVGHTAPKTKENLQRARGGVLFIENADLLYKQKSKRDYGPEAIQVLLQVMENQRDDLILIFSGEKTKIGTFFRCNPGVASRIGNHIDFTNYNVEELMCISLFMLQNQNRYIFENVSFNLLKFYIRQLILCPTFSNARTIQIFLNQLTFYQAARIQKMLSINRLINFKSLITIKEEDFYRFTSADFFNIVGTRDIRVLDEFLQIPYKIAEELTIAFA